MTDSAISLAWVRDDARRGARPAMLWIALGAITMIAAVLAAPPANWLARYVAAKSNGRILFADARGSIWRGDAVLGFAAGRTSSGSDGQASSALALPGRIKWAVEMPRGLALVLRLTHDGVLPQPVDVRIGIGARTGAIAVEAGRALLPAELLRLFGAPLNTLRPEGRLDVRWDALEITDNRPIVAAGEVRFADLALAASTVRPLGDYRAVLKSDERGLSWRLDTERGPLKLEGMGSVSPGSRGKVEASVRASAAADASPQTVARLKPLLDALGRRAGGVAVIEIGS